MSVPADIPDRMPPQPYGAIRAEVRDAWDGLGFVAPSDVANDPALQAVAQVQT